MCMNGQYSMTSHATISKPTSREAQDITCIFDQSQADEAEGSEPNSYLSFRLNRRVIKFLHRERWLGIAEATAQAHRVGHGFAMVAEAWIQLVELHQPV